MSLKINKRSFGKFLFDFGKKRKHNENIQAIYLGAENRLYFIRRIVTLP